MLTGVNVTKHGDKVFAYLCKRQEELSAALLAEMHVAQANIQTERGKFAKKGWATQASSRQLAAGGQK